MPDIRDRIEADIKSACPGDWRRASSNTLTWDLTIEPKEIAVIHGGPYSVDQNGKIVRVFKKPFEACVMKIGGVVLHKTAPTAKAAARIISRYMGRSVEGTADANCPECKGTGKVKLFRGIEDCSICGED